MKAVYLPIQSKMFPVNTTLVGSMGNAIGGLSGILGSANGLNKQQQLFTGWQEQQFRQYYPTARQVHFPEDFDIKTVKHSTAPSTLCPCGHCPVDYSLDCDKYTVTQTANCWLTARVDRVRLLGREWLNASRFKKTFDALVINSGHNTTIDRPKKAPPAVGGFRESLSAGTGIPVRYLPNGVDSLLAYDKLPPGLREEMQKMGLCNANGI